MCVHNAGRSQMAELFFNTLAAERRLEAQAESAGTDPGPRVNPTAVEAMAELGLSLAGSPRLLTAEIAQSADRVITMGCGVQASACPAGTIVGEDWQLDDPHGQGLEQVRGVPGAGPGAPWGASPEGVTPSGAGRRLRG